MRGSDELRDYGPDRNVTGFSLRWIAWLFAIAIVIGAIGWTVHWLSVPAEIASPENVKAQWGFAYEFDESLHAAAAQVCIAKRAKREAVDDNERTQRSSQLAAYEMNYQRIQAQYNARLRDAFQAKLVAPPDVPRRAPTLDALLAQDCTE